MFEAAHEIRTLLEDPRSSKLFEAAAVHLDRIWPYAKPEDVRYIQGMSAMLNLIPKLPEALEAEAERMKNAQAPKRGLEDVREPGREAVEQGLALSRSFSGNGRRK